jgi:ribosomal protein S18 acetylase RimI-like enzyme
MNPTISQYDIKKFENVHINDVIKIHKSTFDKNHFSIYFNKDLIINYFEYLLKYNEYNFIISHQNKIAGYVIAGYKSAEAISKFQKINWLKLSFVLLTHPRFIFEKLNEIFAKDITKTNPRIFIIGISAEYKGASLGKYLIEYLEEQFKRNNIKEYGLSVRRTNLKAINFYKKSGFVSEAENSKSIFLKKFL